MSEQASVPSITVGADGPYEVSGVPVMRRRALKGETGHPEEWETYAHLDDGSETVWLCRCGNSGNKPYCDGSHRRTAFDGTEQAPASTYSERAEVLGGSHLTVSDDRSICQHAGFCATRGSNVWRMVADSDQDDVRERMAGMIDRCPSGALTYRDQDGNEKELPAEVAIIEDGPIFVSGWVPITRADGKLMEARGRVTLCRCGHSANKPLCDGAHVKAGFADG